MSAERRLQAADAFWRDENGASEQAEAIAAIAHRLKFRPKSVVALPVGKKAQYLNGLPGVSELVAARLLVAYHIQHQRPMMAAFLDSLGIAHEDGLIADEEVQPPDPEKIKTAAKVIAERFPREDVAVYLSTLSWQDPEAWATLTDVPEAHVPTGA